MCVYIRIDMLILSAVIAFVNGKKGKGFEKQF